MILEHDGKRPRIDDTAWVAPNAVVCGDVTIGPECRVLFGAVLNAESGPITVGRQCVIMEHAVVRGLKRQPVTIGDHVLVGPHAHLTGCAVESEVFVATGASIFNGARVGRGSTVRINGIVHIGTTLPPESSMPIGYVAIGDPARIYPPSEGEAILEQLRAMDFSGTVFGFDRRESRSFMVELTERYTKGLARHRADRVVGG